MHYIMYYIMYYIIKLFYILYYILYYMLHLNAIIISFKIIVNNKYNSVSYRSNSNCYT